MTSHCHILMLFVKNVAVRLLARKYRVKKKSLLINNKILDKKCMYGITVLNLRINEIVGIKKFFFQLSMFVSRVVTPCVIEGRYQRFG